MTIRYHVGARDEPGSFFGLAHLAEHLMFGGSTHVQNGQHDRLLTQVGATNVNARTFTDETTYFEQVPSERLGLALWLESDRMGYVLDHLDQPSLARERTAVLNEYNEKVRDAALGAVPDILSRELFPAWHPYRHSPFGTPETIAAIRLEDVQAFLGTWYGPANATLAVAGSVDPATAATWARGYFGSLPARPPPSRPPLPPLSPITPTLLRVGANVVRPEVRVVWVTPPLATPGDYELDVAANILAAPQVGWLPRRLGNLATSVSAIQASRELASVFQIRVAGVEGSSPADLARAVDLALAQFNDGISAEDMHRAKQAWYVERLFRLEAIASWSTQLTSAATRQPFLQSYDGDLSMYAAVTPSEVRATVHRFLGRAHRVVAIIQPDRGSPIGGVLLGRRELVE